MVSGCRSSRALATDAGTIATPSPRAASCMSTMGLLASKATCGVKPAEAQASSRRDRIPVPAGRLISARSRRTSSGIVGCFARSSLWLTAATIDSSATTWILRPGGEVPPIAMIAASSRPPRSASMRRSELVSHFELEEALPTVRNGDLAVTSTRPADNTGGRVQLVRRQPDGSWLRVIDRPETWG